MELHSFIRQSNNLNLLLRLRLLPNLPFLSPGHTPALPQIGWPLLSLPSQISHSSTKEPYTLAASSAVEALTAEDNENYHKLAVAVKAAEQPGGKMVVELVGAFNELTERMSLETLSTCSSQILFKALKLSIPVLRTLPTSPDGRSPLSKALSVAVMLADLHMDAEVISAGILREIWDAGAMSIDVVKDQIGYGTAHLLHESLRMKTAPFRIDLLDDKNGSTLRKYYLTYYDTRAIVLNLVLKLDMMRHLHHLPRYQQQMISLEVMKIHAPLAHAVGTNSLSLELEDLSFGYLFPCSYLYVDNWLRSHKTGGKPIIDIYKEELYQALKNNSVLGDMVDGFTIRGRYKSRYSTMKKLLRDGRKPEEVYDIMGLRVVLNPKKGFGDSNEMDHTAKDFGDYDEMGVRACYKTREIICSLWKEVPDRTKDYIVEPKANGYMSLHMAVDVSENGRRRPMMEIQIRTKEMDALADSGAASHSLYKGGLADPKEAKRLKAIMMAAAELAALRLKDFPSSSAHRSSSIEIDHKGRVFQLLDKNGDGRISIEELMDVMGELGGQPEDAQEMMRLLDANSDGSLSSDEFSLFQEQVELMRNMDDRDEQCKIMLEQKLPAPDAAGGSAVVMS